MTELRLEGVGYRFPSGVRALEGIDLHIPAGLTLGIIGANGSGKTTLLRALVGLLRPTEGRVLVDEVDAAHRHVAQLAAVVGLGFQHPEQQIFAREVRAEVEFGPRCLGASGEEAFRRGKAALERVGLGDDLERHPADLGEARRKLLTLASVLAMETPVVALDEPTTGLDAHGVSRVTGIIGDLRESGRSVVLVSHDMRIVAETCDRVVVLEGGRIVLQGSPTEVFAEAAWPHLRAAGLEPPAAAVRGALLALGSTPTEAAILVALAARGGSSALPR